MCGAVISSGSLPFQTAMCLSVVSSMCFRSTCIIVSVIIIVESELDFKHFGTLLLLLCGIELRCKDIARILTRVRFPRGDTARHRATGLEAHGSAALASRHLRDAAMPYASRKQSVTAI